MMSEFTQQQAAQLECRFFDHVAELMRDLGVPDGAFIYHIAITESLRGWHGMQRAVSLHISDEIVGPELGENRSFLPGSVYFPRVTTEEAVDEMISIVRDMSEAYRQLKGSDEAISAVRRIVPNMTGAEKAHAVTRILQDIVRQNA